MNSVDDEGGGEMIDTAWQTVEEEASIELLTHWRGHMIEEIAEIRTIMTGK